MTARRSPPAKRPRRSTSDLIRSQQLRQSQDYKVEAGDDDELRSSIVPRANQVVAEPASAKVQDDKAAAENEDELRQSMQLVIQDYDVEVGDDDKLRRSIQLANQAHKEMLEGAKNTVREEKEAKQLEADAFLQSSEDILTDLSIKTSLKLTSPHLPFKWLRSLPPGLWASRSSEATRQAVRESVIGLCGRTLTAFVPEPDKATRWMERVAGCLSWHEVEGLAVPVTPRAEASLDEQSAWRRVDQWEEAYRGLETLLRQGLVSSYVIVAERFSVVVLGEGSGPVKRSAEGPPLEPSHREPCAVLCPSQDEIRKLLQANYVGFEVAGLLSETTHGSRYLRRSSTTISDPEGFIRGSVDEQKGAIVPFASVDVGQALVPIAEGKENEIVPADIMGELGELRRDGIKVITAEEQSSRFNSRSSALLFEGSWKVHALLDVLRQFFLGAPLRSAPAAQPRLPRLVAPTAFSHARLQLAEVVRTQSTQSGGQTQHSAELRGIFFPKQVKTFLELLRVMMPGFACQLTAEPRHSAGLNAFSELGLRHVSGIECESCGVGPTGSTEWRWKFALSS